MPRRFLITNPHDEHANDSESPRGFSFPVFARQAGQLIEIILP
jgi:hypothetical protein